MHALSVAEFLGFALVSWAAPVWSPDWLAVAFVRSADGSFGLLWKEARWARRFGPEFARYPSDVPYFLPRLRR